MLVILKLFVEMPRLLLFWTGQSLDVCKPDFLLVFFVYIELGITSRSIWYSIWHEHTIYSLLSSFNMLFALIKNSNIVTLSSNALKSVVTQKNPGSSLEMGIAIITARLIVKKHMHLF